MQTLFNSTKCGYPEAQPISIPRPSIFPVVGVVGGIQGFVEVWIGDMNLVRADANNRSILLVENFDLEDGRNIGRSSPCHRPSLLSRPSGSAVHDESSYEPVAATKSSIWRGPPVRRPQITTSKRENEGTRMASQPSPRPASCEHAPPGRSTDYCADSFVLKWWSCSRISAPNPSGPSGAVVLLMSGSTSGSLC